MFDAHSLLADQIRDQFSLMFPFLGDNVGAGSTWKSTAPAIAARLSVVDLDESVRSSGRPVQQPRPTARGCFP